MLRYLTIFIRSFIHSFIHSEDFYSALKNLLLRRAPSPATTEEKRLQLVLPQRMAKELSLVKMKIGIVKAA